MAAEKVACQKRKWSKTGSLSLLPRERERERQTWLAKTRISSLNESDEQTSAPGRPTSRGVHVANSHFSKTSASSGNSG